MEKLSGEARIDALVLELKDKHGIHLSPEVVADADKEDEQCAEPEESDKE